MTFALRPARPRFRVRPAIGLAAVALVSACGVAAPMIQQKPLTEAERSVVLLNTGDRTAQFVLVDHCRPVGSSPFGSIADPNNDPMPLLRRAAVEANATHGLHVYMGTFAFYRCPEGVEAVMRLDPRAAEAAKARAAEARLRDLETQLRELKGQTANPPGKGSP